MTRRRSRNCRWTRENDGQQRDYFAFTKRLRELAGKPMVIRVERGKDATKVDILVPPAFHQTLGHG